MVDDVEQRGFDELSFGKRRADGHNRLHGEHDFALSHRVHVAGEAEVFEVVEKVLGERAERAQVLYVACGKAYVFDILHRLLKPGGYGVVYLTFSAEEHVEGRERIVDSALEIAVHHGELIEIGE